MHEGAPAMNLFTTVCQVKQYFEAPITCHLTKRLVNQIKIIKYHVNYLIFCKKSNIQVDATLKGL